jgi:REP element-mobilizing transposase RayT
LPLLTPAIEPHIRACILAKCQELKCVPIKLGGIEDHVHLLIRLHTTVAVATLLKEVKGSSSHLVTHEITPGQFFKWQGAYGAFTIAKEAVPRVIEYIERQREHHMAQTFLPEWEQTETDNEPSD